MKKCSDDYLDALRYFFESKIEFTEVNMRFEIKKIENETLNVFYGDVYTIKDNLDEDSPTASFRFLKPTAVKVCAWLNENLKDDVKDLTPRQKIDKLVDELWGNNDRVMVEYNNAHGMYYLVEKESSGILEEDIAERLGISSTKVEIEVMSPNKAIFKIKNGDLL